MHKVLSSISSQHGVNRKVPYVIKKERKKDHKQETLATKLEDFILTNDLGLFKTCI